MLYAMRLLSIFLLLVTGAQVLASPALELPVYSQGYDPARDPFSDGRAALQLAKDTQRKVLIEVGGNWCSWCHVLDRFLNEHPSLRTRLHEIFVLLKVNVDESGDNEEFLSIFPKALGYPHMYVTDKDGTILFSQDTAEFLRDGKYSEQRFQAFLARWSMKHD